MSNYLPSYQDKTGIWMLYSYDASPYVIRMDIDPVPLARIAARQAYGSVGFWPLEMEFANAVTWWEAQDAPHPLDDSIVHFFYNSPERCSMPICKESPSDEWVQFDHTAIGKICPDCLDRIGRTIK